MLDMPEAYRGREQAFVKHTVLETYLQRLFMIIGRGKEQVINYVDCFAGPWQENDEQLSDTSIGISLAQIDQCRQSLLDRHKSTVKFRALYIEKNPESFKKLQSFLANSPYKHIETHCLAGDYTDLLNEIVQWCGQHFTFFFVDPTGWQNVIGFKSMSPLLQLPRSEFLINLMYDFVNRAATIARHENDMKELFGEVPQVDGASPQYRQKTQLQLYRDKMTTEYGGRSTYVPIEKPGKDRVHYFLVYLTRSAYGIKTFKEIAEDMAILQRDVQADVSIRTRTEKSGISDMFSDAPQSMDQPGQQDLNTAKMFLMEKLGGKELRIDYEQWANLLEESDYLPSQLQAAMKALIEEGRAENLDASVNRRTKNIVKPDYLNKSERWKFKTSS